MKTIKSSKDITTLEVGDKVIFGYLEYEVAHSSTSLDDCYYLDNLRDVNDVIFERLNINKKDFVKKLGIAADCDCDFPETKSLEALTAIVAALFKEYEKQNQLPKTWEEFCKRNKMGDKKFYLYDGVIVGTGVSKNTVKDTILIESAEEAQAFRALMQLRQLRKAYIKDWEPDWEDIYEDKFCVAFCQNELSVLELYDSSCPLSFPTKELAIQFLNNFKDLLEIARPLL